MTTVTTVTPLTQKAQGIVAILDGCPVLSLEGPGVPLTVIPGSGWGCLRSEGQWPMFARPCPFRPRHGFEESVRVFSWEEVIRTLQRAKAADPKNPVEVVLAPLLTGAVSAVATNAGVTWGKGNDGVTAGKDPKAFFIPVKTANASWHDVVNSIVGNESDFAIPKFPYLEIVENQGDMCLVQVRDGPEQPEGVNHVVRKMKVQWVLKAEPFIDLLDWEDLVHKATRDKGTVIWAPGMSLSSHFCVHGIESGIPVITDHKVAVGDVIQATKNRTSTLGKREYAKVAAVITETLGRSLNLGRFVAQKEAILTAIATTQAQFCWGKEPHLLRLRGLAIVVLLKAVIASCAGEIRHWATCDGPGGDGRIRLDGPGDPSLYGCLDGVAEKRYNRREIYKNVFNRTFTLSKMEHVLEAAIVDLGASGWTRAFGGRRWVEVASTGIELSQATKRFCDHPCASTWAKVVQKTNRLINTSHNNGKCLTKWVETLAMTMISDSPTAGFLNPYVAQVALEMTDKGVKS